MLLAWEEAIHQRAAGIGYCWSCTTHSPRLKVQQAFAVVHVLVRNLRTTLKVSSLGSLMMPYMVVCLASH